MTFNNISEIRPHRVNAGGIFIALLKGALQPLSCVVTVPLTLLFPSLTTFFLYHVFSKQNVHWYKKELIPLFSESVVRGGFIYIETITARGTNYLQLPEYGYIKKVLSNFKIIYCKEKLVNPVNENKATITILAEKNRTKV